MPKYIHDSWFIDFGRLMMMPLTDSSIRDVILFPTMKPLHAGQGLT